MNDSGEGARHKAVLAAVLAVQRGFLSPDEAVRVLADLPAGAGPEPMQTLLSVTPTSAQAAITAEVEAMSADPGRIPATLAEMGVNAQVQDTLLALKPDTSSEAATKALSNLAERRRRVEGLTSKLPGASASGRYQLKREFARGGMGLIWMAMDTAVGREVALKELLPPKLGHGSSHITDSPELVERFLREAKVTGQLEHPNIVPVYEIGAREDGSVFYTMKLVRGKTMAHRLLQIQGGSGSSQEKLADRLKLLDAFVDVCNAIAYAHSRGVIHRDLKPANIMLGDFGETLVLDWGLARVQGQDDSSGVRRQAEKQAFSPSLLQDDSENRTLDGAVLGTPAYMPPEQARGELDKVDERADVYALGAILYEILCGRPPYEGATARDVLARVLVLEPEPLARLAPLAPPDLVSLVGKAMDRHVSQRLQSAAQFAQEVLAFRDGRNISVHHYSTRDLAWRFVRRHKGVVAVAAIALVLLLGGGAYAFLSVTSERDRAQGALDELAQAEQQKIRQREKAIDDRKTEVKALRRAIERRRGAWLAGAAKSRMDDLQGSARGVDPADQAENSQLVEKLLELSAMRERLIRLVTAPVQGEVHEFMTTGELEEEASMLRYHRLLAMELAILNEDFGFATFILGGTELPDDERAGQVAQIEAGRREVLTRHRAAIQAALEDVRLGLARANRPRGNIRLEDYVLQLSAYREEQTVELLTAVLEPATRKAAGRGTELLWTQTERDEITLACRVLASLELPDLSVPPLAAFLEVIEDSRLAIECGTALCQTAHAMAYAPLMAARVRLGKQGYVWGQIKRLLNRVPEPLDLPAPADVAGLLQRATVRSEQGNTAGARLDAEAALALQPDNAEVLVFMAGLDPWDARALELVERAVLLAPGMARAWGLRGRINSAQERTEIATPDLDKAIELDPRDITCRSYRAWHRWVRLKDPLGALEDYNAQLELDPYSWSALGNRAGIYFEVGKYDLAVGDATRAIELNPWFAEAWNNRASARAKLGDVEGAIADLTRMLEVAPGHPWAHMNRAAHRVTLKQFRGAIDDYDKVVAYAGGTVLTYGWYGRGVCHEALGEKEKAAADFRKFLELEPDADDRADIEARIAALEK